MKLFDCFPFLNEVELLELRLAELGAVVDYFVIVEANKTHAGNPKEFVFAQERERYRAYLDRIIYVQVTDLPDSDPTHAWVAENFQRNAIMRGLQGLAQPGDKIMVSDVDEIPSVSAIQANLSNPYQIVFKQALYYYYVNCRVSRNWGGTIMAPYGAFDSAQQLRNATRRHSFGVYPAGGWHYSYLAGNDPARIIYKAQCIVDAYSGYHVGTPAEVAQKVRNHVDLYERPFWHTKLRIIDLATEPQPAHLAEFLARYPQFFWREAA